ncbi:hypothetical protein EXIGLDRAFT_126660 [Exidia glandulosa HHB12029]|uniref:Uncharacterized protein n=1 Tax=Exidia glandulosa HHB12029 TaxID=1314781 RepID=A0A165G9L5_EXIGL|nr:hypothetical protein EXIGLDRAFT_126660 [Exidia glandulosa HHB12029]
MEGKRCRAGTADGALALKWHWSAGLRGMEGSGTKRESRVRAQEHRARRRVAQKWGSNDGSQTTGPLCTLRRCWGRVMCIGNKGAGEHTGQMGGRAADGAESLQSDIDSSSTFHRRREPFWSRCRTPAMLDGHIDVRDWSSGIGHCARAQTDLVRVFYAHHPGAARGFDSLCSSSVVTGCAVR